MDVGVLFAISLPGLVVLLVVLALVERIRRGKTAGPGPLTSAGVEELDGLLSGGKRLDMVERQSRSMMRDEEGDNAPPRGYLDLDAGVARIDLPDRRDS